MKQLRKAGIILIIFIILLSGCKKLAPDRKLSENYKKINGFTSKISVHSKDLDYTFEFTKRDRESYSLILTSPASLSGLKIERIKEKTSISYKELFVPLDFLPSEMYNGIDKIAFVLMDIEKAASELPVTKKSETAFEISGKLNEYIDVSFLFDIKRLIPLSVTTNINGNELKAKITEFKLL